MDRWPTRKTRETNYVASMLKSLRDFSRIWTEKRYEERVRASRSLGFSRFLDRLFSCAKPRKHSFSRLTRFSRRLYWLGPQRCEEGGPNEA
jgi:hypothetical protein